MQGKLSERSFKDANVERTKARNKRFEELRQAKHLQQEFDELDYLQFYPLPIKRAIILSLTAPIPEPLPPLDVTTISYYRRESKPIFQTRLPGNAELDPHMTHESLHILSMTPEAQYPNFAGLTREFQKDLKLYLSARSADIRTMAIIAAGNHIIGREKDILALVEENITSLWVLFNHIFSEKISYKALLPFILKSSEIAYQAFYQFSNIPKHESIEWLFDNEEVVESLLRGLESPDIETRRLALRIFGNVLGEQNENYAAVLINSSFMDSLFKFLLSSDTIFRKDACWVLANFCSYKSAATVVLRNQKIIEKLVELLYYDTVLEVRKEIAHIFNYIISLADEQLAFERIIMAIYLDQNDIELSIITLNVIQGLLNLGEQFKDENEHNVVVQMVQGLPDLRSELLKCQYSQNCLISQSCNSILTFLNQSEQMEGEC